MSTQNLAPQQNQNAGQSQRPTQVIDAYEEVLEITPTQGKQIWTHVEDEALIFSYFTSGMDPEDGTNQKLGPLWQRVQTTYHVAQSTNPQKISPRSVGSMKNRWKRMIRSISRWVGCLEEASRRRRSGEKGENVLHEAHVLYEVTYKCKFSEMRAFLKMQLFPRWETVLQKKQGEEVKHTGSSGKRVRLDNEECNSPPSKEVGCFTADMEFGSSTCPEGIKGKKKVTEAPGDMESVENLGREIGSLSKSVEKHFDYQERWRQAKITLKNQELAMRDQELAMRDREAKMALLQKFVEKGEDNLNGREMRIYLKLLKDLDFDV